jgi:hypothetical protein
MGSSYYHCDKTYEFNLCVSCFQEETFPPNVSQPDFAEVKASKKGVESGENLADEELENEDDTNTFDSARLEPITYGQAIQVHSLFPPLFQQQKRIAPLTAVVSFFRFGRTSSDM